MNSLYTKYIYFLLAIIRMHCTSDIINLLFIFQLNIKGYNDKQQVLLEKVLDKVTSFTVDPKRFEILKDAVSID